MELLLVRHGQPKWLDDDGLGDNDPGLTAIGRVQALQTAARLASLDVTELLASTAQRAQETVAPIAHALELPVTSDDGLWEIHPPEHWQGAPAEVVADDFRAWRRLPREQWWDGPHGEPFRDFHERVTSTLERLLAERGVRRERSDPDHLWDVDREDRRRFVLVSHNGTGSVILSHLLGIDPQPWEWERFNAHHASVTMLRTTPIASAAIWSLRDFSAVDHLDERTR